MVYVRNLPEEPSVVWRDNGQTVLSVNGKRKEDESGRVVCNLHKHFLIVSGNRSSAHTLY